MTDSISSASLTMKALGCVNGIRNFYKNVGKSPQASDGTIEGEETDELHNKIKPTVMDLTAVGAVASGVTTMVLTESHIADAACYSTCAMGPLAAVQKRKLNSMGGLRGQQNVLREHVNRLTEENDKLTASVDKLEGAVDGLEGVESALDEFCKEKGASVERLTGIVKKNGEIQVKIKKNLEREVIANIISLVVQADRDQDFSLSKNEMEMLIFRLHGVSGVEFDEENFRKRVAPPMTLKATMDVLRNLTDDTVNEEDNIFHIKPETLA